MCLHFYLVLFEQVGYSIFLVQYRKVFSDQYNFFERVDLTFVLLYVYCVLRRMGGILRRMHFYMVSLLHSEQLRCVLMVLPGSQLHHDISPHWIEQAHNMPAMASRPSLSNWMVSNIYLTFMTICPTDNNNITMKSLTNKFFI